jgi:hypothetical protein
MNAEKQPDFQPDVLPNKTKTMAIYRCLSIILFVLAILFFALGLAEFPALIPFSLFTLFGFWVTRMAMARIGK